MDLVDVTKFKWILILEFAFAGAYVSITRGLFIVFLTTSGYGVDGISFVILISTIVSTCVGLIIYKFPSFIRNNVKAKLIAFHGFGRLIWFLMPLIDNITFILFFYSIYMVFSFFVSVFMNFTIYGSLQDQDVKDVLAKRSASGGLSSVIGLILGIFLLAYLPPESKFVYIFSLGAFIGILSTILLLFLNFSCLDFITYSRAIEKPEKVFSTSLFLVILITGGSLLTLMWTPYIITTLNAPDYFVGVLNLVGTISSIIASLAWRGRNLKTLRKGNILSSLSPLIIIFTSVPVLHIFISAFNSFMYTGANFLGTFLFAEYKKWYGAVKSSIILTIIGNIALLLVAPLGIIIKENYLFAFLSIFVILLFSALLALFLIPEVSIIPEIYAGTYSSIIYRTSLIGYSITLQLSKKMALTTIKLIALTFVLIMLYVIYRFLTIALVNLNAV